MSSDSTPTKDQSEAGEAPDADLIAMDDLDAMIAAEDPEFSSRVKTMAAEGAKSDLNIEILDLDRLLEEEQKKQSRLKSKMASLRKTGVQLKVAIVHFAVSDLPILGKAALKALKSGLAAVGETLRLFNYKPRKFKLLVFAFILILGAAGSGVYFLIRRGLPADQKLFVQSMGELADSVVTDAERPTARREPFYDSVRAAQNILSLNKLIANLKRTEVSGPNPMVVVEFFVEGNSPDVVVEIKARETEVRDAFLRTIEEFTGEELDTPAGKQKLLDRLARDANRIVTEGRVQRVLFKTIVLQL